jgi:hypothetical protein
MENKQENNNTKNRRHEVSLNEKMKMEQDEISTISNECNRKVSQKEKHKQSEINACLRCGGDKCVCDREKQHTTKITTKSLINSP